MIEKLKEQIINDSSLELTPFQIDYLVKELDKINPYFEVARCEVLTSIDDLYNDDVYDFKDKLDKLSEEDINRIAWKVEDYDIFRDAYETAREEVEEQAHLWEEEENDN